MRKATVLAESTDAEAEQREKVIVRSNGTVTYVGKDIANQFWKFGLLGRDFNYRVFVPREPRPLWATTSHAADSGAPPFGRASAVYNVIDSRQSYLQQLLKQALATMGFAREAERLDALCLRDGRALARDRAGRSAMTTAKAPASRSSRCPAVAASG